jgi:WhiB family redox-sensing transcriptional regulator
VTIGRPYGSRAPTADASWRDLANCRFTRPDLFFPAGSTGPAADEIEAAKAVCEACAVKAACLQFALETNQEPGIWGGTTEDERRRLRRVWLANRRHQSRVTA